MIDKGGFGRTIPTKPIDRLALLLVLGVMPAIGAAAQPGPASLEPSPHAIDIPRWFEETFLDFREDVREAAAKGKRLMVYFGQDGCPYCGRLMQVNFTQKDLVDKTRRHFVAIAINIWGDREVTWTDGRVQTEKKLAATLKV
jgi:thioredoxin-related protein